YCSAGCTRPYILLNASAAPAPANPVVLDDGENLAKSASCPAGACTLPDISSATARPQPGSSLIQLAAAVHRPFTSGVSPSRGWPSGVIEISPLIAYLIPAFSSPSSSGISSSEAASCGSKSSAVNGISVGESTASSLDGIVSGGTMIGRCM